MAYELWNPHTADMRLTLGAPWGFLEIKSHCYFPTPEQEKAGMHWQNFSDLIGKSFLQPTPPRDRRRLLEAAGLPVPSSLVEATRRFPEYSGRTPGAPEPVAAPVADASVMPTTPAEKTAAEKLKEAGLERLTQNAQSAASVEDLQKMVDAKCSSTSRHGKKPMEVP